MAASNRIAMLARTDKRLADLAAEVPAAKAFVCDVSDQTQVDAALHLVEREMGAPFSLISSSIVAPRWVPSGDMPIDGAVHPQTEN
jgi:enoyl-[acyl-carrier-protein] reductase (NADH)